MSSASETCRFLLRLQQTLRQRGVEINTGDAYLEASYSSRRRGMTREMHLLGAADQLAAVIAEQRQDGGTSPTPSSFAVPSRPPERRQLRALRIAAEE